eukprot:PhM_4_TR5582/c0_g1_i1/m.29640
MGQNSSKKSKRDPLVDAECEKIRKYKSLSSAKGRTVIPRCAHLIRLEHNTDRQVANNIKGLGTLSRLPLDVISDILLFSTDSVTNITGTLAVVSYPFWFVVFSPSMCVDLFQSLMVTMFPQTNDHYYYNNNNNCSYCDFVRQYQHPTQRLHRMEQKTKTLQTQLDDLIRTHRQKMKLFARERMRVENLSKLITVFVSIGAWLFVFIPLTSWISNHVLWRPYMWLFWSNYEDPINSTLFLRSRGFDSVDGIVTTFVTFIAWVMCLKDPPPPRKQSTIEIILMIFLPIFFLFEMISAGMRQYQRSVISVVATASCALFYVATDVVGAPTSWPMVLNKIIVGVLSTVGLASTLFIVCAFYVLVYAGGTIGVFQLTRIGLSKHLNISLKETNAEKELEKSYKTQSNLINDKLKLIDREQSALVKAIQQEQVM